MSVIRPWAVSCVLCLASLLITLCFAANDNSSLGEESPSSLSHRSLRATPEHIEKDIAVAKSLAPLKDGHNIMFWRLQKVGSSTLLSIFVSYAFRFHFVPRRKASMNSFCRVIGSSALATHHMIGKGEGLKNITALLPILPRSVRDRSTMSQYWGERANETILHEDMESLLYDYSFNSVGSRQGWRSRPFSKHSPSYADEVSSATIPHRVVLSHEMCNLDARVVERFLPLAFPAHGEQQGESESGRIAAVDEVFMVRDPLSRAVSVYYFWGELFKLAQQVKTHQQTKPREHRSAQQGKKHSRPKRDRERRLQAHNNNNGEEERRALAMLGEVVGGKEVHGLFRYHGNESSVPPLDVALSFAERFPYQAGMPGPSYSWSAFADNADDTLRRVRSSPALFTVVLERLDESLVAMRYFLNWSLADVVMTKQRKALSSHPKSADWPEQATRALRQKLQDKREYDIYDAARQRLDERIAGLTAAGVDVAGEVRTLQALRTKVTQVCLDQEDYLDHYREMIAQRGLLQHHSQNKLRDVEQRYFDNGHVFSLNMEILGSFDVCGACEAHALLKGLLLGLATDIANSTTLFDLSFEMHRKNDLNFRNCPQTKVK